MQTKFPSKFVPEAEKENTQNEGKTIHTLVCGIFSLLYSRMRLRWRPCAPTENTTHSKSNYFMNLRKQRRSVR